MVYEIVLADACTRKCQFCWVPQTGYIASHADIQHFIEQVLVREDNHQQKFRISLFGGEPLLNQNGVRQVVSAFQEDHRVSSIDICTNADLFEEFEQSCPDLVQKLIWGISAYDFFESESKRVRYFRIAKKLNAALMYTFTSSDISQASNFSETCWKNDTRFKIAFSHSASSWDALRADEIYKLVFDIVYCELAKTIERYPQFMSIAVMKPLRMVVGHMLKGSQSACRWCLDCNEKMAFYKGEFVGSCMQESIKKLSCKTSSMPSPLSCRDCDYISICTKSCMFEHDAYGNVPASLCAIERAQLDAFCQFAEAKKYDLKWRLVLRQIIEKDINYG